MIYTLLPSIKTMQKYNVFLQKGQIFFRFIYSIMENDTCEWCSNLRWLCVLCWCCVLRADFTLASVLNNQSDFQHFLVRNLSLSNSTASLLLNTPLNTGEVIYFFFNYLFRSHCKFLCRYVMSLLIVMIFFFYYYIFFFLFYWFLFWFILTWHFYVMFLYKHLAFTSVKNGHVIL